MILSQQLDSSVCKIPLTENQRYQKDSSSQTTFGKWYSTGDEVFNKDESCIDAFHIYNKNKRIQKDHVVWLNKQ